MKSIVKMKKGLSLGLAILIGSAFAPSASAAAVYTFNTCGATGATGPTQAACNASYAATTLNGLVAVSGGIQAWMVPLTGMYHISAEGAQGASAQAGRIGGKGALIEGDFMFTSGTILNFLVGQMGLGQSSGSNGGGGGGSFVVGAGATPLLVAGGGGGTRTSAQQNGTDASITTSAYKSSVSSATYVPSLKGTAIGLGGAASSTSWGSGGGGFYSDGGADAPFGDGGNSWANGMTGGASTYVCGSSAIANGGFGGGGTGKGCYGGGGGGGYSGGDGGFIAGGGGSFNAGSNQLAFAGLGFGDGLIVVTSLTAVPEPASLALFGLGLLGFGMSRRKKA